MRNTPLVAACAVALGACGPGGGNVDAGRDIGRLEGGNNFIGITPGFAFEGQRRFVAIIGPGRDNMTNATVTADAPIAIESVACTQLRCIVVAHVDDTMPNTGSSIPEPASGRAAVISVVSAELNYSANVSIFPLDTADGAALGAGRITSDAVYSTLDVAAGTVLRASMELPVRFAVMNTAEVHGTFDFSGVGVEAGPGGHGGAETGGMDGQGPFPGRGSTTGGGGGGGHAQAGGAGTGTMPGEGGAMSDDTAFSRGRGGSGGGSGLSGTGGGGGGAFSLALFGTANFEGASFLVRGADGTGVSGGGAGGTMLLAGNPTGAFTIDLAGGRGGSAGGSRGGDGSPGRLRFDGTGAGATVTAGENVRGVRFDVTSVPALVREPRLTIRGFAAPGTRVHVQNEISGMVSGMQYDATTGADGAWSVDATLTVGVSSFIAYAVAGSVRVPSLSGTTVVVRSPASGGGRQLYAGAIDVGYLPMAE